MELNGAENVYGPAKGISKDPIENALVVLSKGEGNTMIGRQDLDDLSCSESPSGTG